MSRYLNIGIMQSGNIEPEFGACLKRIENDVDTLMQGMNKPDLIVGVEHAIGDYFPGGDLETGGDTIPGKVTDKLAEIAKKHGVYLMPGTMLEKKEVDGKTIRYNSAPIFGPDGELIDVYRKICPFYPAEANVTPGDKYVVFDVKGIKVGAEICHDWCFPEITRNLALLGAEVIIKPAVDPEGMMEPCMNIAPTRALENQVYFVSLNWAGDYLGWNAYGHSMIVRPDASILYEAGGTPTLVTITLDIDQVRDARKYGTMFSDQYLRQLAVFNPPQPYANKYNEAPIVKELPPADITYEERREKFLADGLNA